MQHLERILIQQDAIELFVKGASIEVSGEWSQWLGKMLTKRRGVHTTGLTK